MHMDLDPRFTHALLGQQRLLALPSAAGDHAAAHVEDKSAEALNTEKCFSEAISATIRDRHS